MSENTRALSGRERVDASDKGKTADFPPVAESVLRSGTLGNDARNGACAARPASSAQVEPLADEDAQPTARVMGLSYVPKVTAHGFGFPSRADIDTAASTLNAHSGVPAKDVFSAEKDYVLSVSAGTLQLKNTRLALHDFRSESRAIEAEMMRFGWEKESSAGSDFDEGRKIQGWSPKSRANMVRSLSQLDYRSLIEHPNSVPAMVTLTLPGCAPEALAESQVKGEKHVCDERCYWVPLCPDGPDFKAKVKTLMKRWQRRYGILYEREYERVNKKTGVVKKSVRTDYYPIPAVFKLEFQRRTAPHVHILAPVPIGSDLKFFREWLSNAWAEIVTGEHEKVLVGDPEPSVIFRNHKRAGTGIDLAAGAKDTDPRRLAIYFSKHAAPGKTDKEYQHTSLPKHWDKVGRFWWYSGIEKYTEEVAISEQDYLIMRRLIARSSAYYSTVPVKNSSGKATEQTKVVRRYATKAYGNRVSTDTSMVCSYPGLFRTYNDAPLQLHDLIRAVKIIREPMQDPLQVPLQERLRVYKETRQKNF